MREEPPGRAAATASTASAVPGRSGSWARGPSGRPPSPSWPACTGCARARPGGSPAPDAANRDVTRLLLEAGNRLPPGALEIALLELDGRPLAAQSTLRGGGTTYLMVSGLDWIWWELGAMTEVIGEIIQAAIRRGDRAVNLSTGPVVSKLRWSERLELHQDFTLVSDQPRSQALFSAYTLAQRAPALPAGAHPLPPDGLPLGSGYPRLIASPSW